MLAVTKNRSRLERHGAVSWPYMVRCVQLVIITCILDVLFLVTASISPCVQAVWELHALSLPLVGQYALDIYGSVPSMREVPLYYVGSLKLVHYGGVLSIESSLRVH